MVSLRITLFRVGGKETQMSDQWGLLRGPRFELTVSTPAYKVFYFLWFLSFF